MELFTELAKQGVLALLLAILGYAYLRKDKALSDAYEKRVEDNNKLATVIEATNAASKALEATSENRSRVIESVGEATKATADAIRSQAAILEHVRSATEKTNQATALLREDFDVLKKDHREDFEALRKELLVALAKSRRTARVAKGSAR